MICGGSGQSGAAVCGSIFGNVIANPNICGIAINGMVVNANGENAIQYVTWNSSEMFLQLYMEEYVFQEDAVVLLFMET